MSERTGESVAFIVSTPRAGSTLLGAMLGSHSQMLCPPEPWLMLLLSTMRSEAIRAQAPWGYEMARDALRQLADDGLFGAGCRAMVGRIYGELLERAGKRVFLDKTPRYFHILPQLDAIFPAARQIWINRNPLDVVASLKETWHFPVSELLGDVLSPYSFDATLSLGWLADHFESLGAHKAVVRYETLVSDPQTESQRLCEFMGVSFEPAMLNYGENRKLVDQYAAGSMGDKKILAHARPHAQSLGRWKTKLSGEELGRIVRVLGPDIFERLGYADAWREACGIAGVDSASVRGDGEMARLARQYEEYQGTEKLSAELAACEADRARRLELIQQLSGRIDEIEADRVARLADNQRLTLQIDPLRKQLDEALMQCAARQELLERQAEEIGRIEADRAARLADNQTLTSQIDPLRKQLDEAMTQCAARQELLERQAEESKRLLSQIREIEADRAQRLQAMERADAELKIKARQHAEMIEHQEQLRRQLSEQSAIAARANEALQQARTALDSPAARLLRRWKFIHYKPTDHE